MAPALATADPGPSRWEQHLLQSEALRDNPLGDPAQRPLFVWTPPAYEDPMRRFPVLYVLHAMTSQARAFFNVAPFEPTLAELVEGAGLEAIVVVPDGFSSLGGSQWIDSAGIGAYGRYLHEDVVGYVDARFRTLAEPAHRGIAGTSSGGFGAAAAAMLRPDLFGGFASHAGDCLFEVTLAGEFGPAAQTLRNLYGGSFERFWADFRSGRPVLDSPADALLQNLYTCAAAYSPGPDGRPEIPFALDTGELVGEVFARWLAFDPVRLAAQRAAALRGLRAIWIDAGTRDEYRLDLGATAFRAALSRAGVPDEVVHFELFDGGHRRLSRRLPESLAFLERRLQRAQAG